MLSAMFSGRHELRQLDDGAFFIDRDPKYFRYVLNFLRTGTLSWPENEIAKKLIKIEFDYYAIDYEGRGLPNISGDNFEYTSDFDKKGYLYYIATDEGKSSWTNPRAKGLVDLTVESGFYRIINDSAERYDIEEDKNLAFEYNTSPDRCLCSPSGSEDQCYMVIDLKEARLKLTAITMSCSYSPGTYLENCVFFGCNDMVYWKTIAVESEVKGSNKKVKTWKVKMDDSVRYFKISNIYQVLISGLELYGSVEFDDYE